MKKNNCEITLNKFDSEMNKISYYSLFGLFPTVDWFSSENKRNSQSYNQNDGWIQVSRQNASSFLNWSNHSEETLQ